MANLTRGSGSIKLWDVNNGANRVSGKFFRMTRPQLNAWKNESWIDKILQVQIQQTTKGLNDICHVWQNRIPKTWENMNVVFDTIEDAPGTWDYAVHLRRVIYKQKGRIWDPNTGRGTKNGSPFWMRYSDRGWKYATTCGQRDHWG